MATQLDFSVNNQNNDVYRAILEKYEKLRNQLGDSASNNAIEFTAGLRKCWKKTYKNGAIYYVQIVGACAVYGSIFKKYVNLGAEKSLLGLPITDETGTPDGIGRFNHFEKGSIYWTAKTGAFEVHGGIKDKWKKLGWEKSFLGYPITDEIKTPDTIGRYNHFEKGSIYWTPTLGANAVRKEIRDEWERRGWEKGILGYPVSDTTTVQPNTFKNDFQGGSISWSQSTGYTVVIQKK